MSFLYDNWLFSSFRSGDRNYYVPKPESALEENSITWIARSAISNNYYGNAKIQEDSSQWSEDEDNYLRKNMLVGLSLNCVAKGLGKTEKECMDRWQFLLHKWSKETNTYDVPWWEYFESPRFQNIWKEMI